MSRLSEIIKDIKNRDIKKSINIDRQLAEIFEKHINQADDTILQVLSKS